jgi:TetR/AcrR family transcriptional regulator, regulator of autoinduction and epiphytic fitness
MVATPEKNRTRDTSRKRAEILLAAAQVFGEQGFDNASMDRIAERANASKRTVYNHFPSKEELFQAVFAKFVGEQQALKQITHDPKRSLEDQLSDFADSQLFLVNTPIRLGISRVLATQFIQDPSKNAAARAEFAPIQDALEIWLIQATKAGRLEVQNPALATQVFYAMIEGAFNYPALSGCLEMSTIAPLKTELILTFLSRYRKNH